MRASFSFRQQELQLWHAVLKGQAGAGLLASYDAERRPVAHANGALSVANWHEAMTVPRALGLDPAAASALQAVVASGPVSLLPKGTFSGWEWDGRQQQIGCSLFFETSAQSLLVTGTA